MSPDAKEAYRIVRTILVPSAWFSPRNWIIWPPEMGSVGLNDGGLELSYPVVKSTTFVIVRPASSVG